MSTSFLHEIDTGKKSFSAYTLEQLSKALEVDADYILSGKKRMEKYKNMTISEEIFSRETLLCIQQLLMQAYNEIQELIDMDKERGVC